MSFNVSSLTDYSDKATGLFVTKTLLADDMERYSFEDDVQYSKLLSKASVTVTPQAGTCGLNSSGGTEFSTASITVSPIAYNIEYCFEDLQEKAIKIDRQAIAKGADIENELTDAHVAKIKKNLENLMWVGDVDSGDVIEGWFTTATDDSDTLHIDSDYGDLAQSAITVSNIDEYVEAFVDKAVETEKIWAAVEAGEYITLHVSPKLYNLYKKHQLANNLFRDADKNLAVNEIWLSGYENQVSLKQEPALAISDSTAKTKSLMTYDSNLVYGSSMVDQVTSPLAKWVVDEVTDYVYFKSALRLGTTIMDAGSVITSY